MRFRSARLGFAFAVALPTLAPASPPPLEPCERPGLATPARCARYPVFEDRAAGAGRTIELEVVVVPASSGQPTREAITFFAGGPGDSSTRAIGFLAEHLAAARATRDLVVVDFRGTGGSTPLDCSELGTQGFLDSFLPADKVAACRERLERDRALAFYTTNEAVDDIAEVLSAYGYTKTNLYGVSYGTRAAQVFARRHPGLVRTMTLEGAMRMNERDPLDFARYAQNALDQLFAECAADPACIAAFPDLAGDLARVFARLDRAPVEVAIVDPTSGAEHTLRLTRNGFAQTVRYMLYLVTTSVALPYQLHAAAEGDFRPIAETAQMFGSFMSGAGDGFFLSVICPEDTRAIREEEVAAAVAGTFLGDFRIRAQQAACAAWTPRAPDPAFGQPLASAIPTLLVSGERDPVTPASSAEAVASTLSRSLHLVVPDGAHDVSGLTGLDCLKELMNRFVEAGDVAGLDASCVSAITRPPFVVAGRAAAVELSVAELEPYVGRYRHPVAGLELELTLANGTLRMGLPGRPPLALRPLSPVRFEPVGMPDGFALEFVRDAEGRVTTLVFFEPGSPEARLDRLP